MTRSAKESRISRRTSRARNRCGQVALCGLVFAGGCEREGGLHYPRVAANGPTGNCPERAVTQSGPGGYPTHDALRCSYTDAQGKGQSKVRGSVYGEQPGMFPGQPLEAVTVTVHKAESDQSLGKQLGRARTDAQGHFTLSAMLPANTYVVVARDGAGLELARTTLVSSDQNPNIARIQLLVPMDPELRRSQEESGPQTEPETDPEPEPKAAPPVEPAPKREDAADPAQPSTQTLPPAKPLDLSPRPKVE